MSSRSAAPRSHSRRGRRPATPPRSAHIDFTGDAGETSAPEVRHVGGHPGAGGAEPRRRPDAGPLRERVCGEADFRPATGSAVSALQNPTTLNFAGASDRGGGFVEPSVGVKALSRSLGAVGDDGSSAAGGIAQGQFDPEKFLEGALPKLFGLFKLQDIIPKAGERSARRGAQADHRAGRPGGPDRALRLESEDRSMA